MTVVIIGPPAAGKTRIGRRVAKLLGQSFTDTDKQIVALHGAIPEIFETHGEPYFRQLERAEVVHALSAGGVVSFGGGAVLNVATQFDLETCLVVLFTVTSDAVKARLGNSKRPLVPDVEAWQRVVDARRDLYADLADFTIDTSHRKADDIAEEVAAWVRAQLTKENV
ncbi:MULTISPECIES: shikimate kinase [Subtercola]|uniref:Shikimate kinase n=1 Tax=Subtercola vilae TaxID=2056433 RepID=A0A4T2C194_9MICO|nr:MULTISPECIES: shikimate kinase [Subtercola]MEA9985111.1 shikimate kinase [Subtercola sp. RTI3]TIH37690.1 shikimate kinase [Subtercola vilae]